MMFVSQHVMCQNDWIQHTVWKLIDEQKCLINFCVCCGLIIFECERMQLCVVLEFKKCQLFRV